MSRRRLLLLRGVVSRLPLPLVLLLLLLLLRVVSLLVRVLLLLGRLLPLLRRLLPHGRIASVAPGGRILLISIPVVLLVIAPVALPVPTTVIPTVVVSVATGCGHFNGACLDGDESVTS